MRENVFFIIQDDKTPLYAAAGRNSLEIVTKLLDSGADLHVRDKVRTFFLSNYIPGCIAVFVNLKRLL